MHLNRKLSCVKLLFMNGEQLAEWLKVRDLSASEFADRYNKEAGTGLRSTYINEMTSGKRDVSFGVVLFVKLTECQEEVARLKEKIISLVTG